MRTLPPTASELPPPLRPAAERVSDVVFRELAGEILRGERAPGGPMPAEREVAARFGVSKVVVRQALYALEQLGLIDVRQGRPTVVRDPDDALSVEAAVLELQLAPERNVTRLADFAEAAVLHMAGVLELAERRASDAALDAVESLLDEHEARGAPSVAFARLEERFWVSLARATDNRVLWKQTRWWFRFLHQQRQIGSGMSPPAARLTMYRELLSHLRRRDGSAARYRELATLHLGLEPARGGSS